MAIINDPNITAKLQELAENGEIDSNDVISLLNAALPGGQKISNESGTTTGIYKRFGEFDKVNAKVEVVTTGLWTGDVGSLSTMFTSPTQISNQTGNYYYNVYDKDPDTNSSAEVQFAVAYGHINGGGSVSLQNDDNALLASKATYAQYRSILLDPTDDKFSFEDNNGDLQDSDDIYVINISRDRYREKMDPGNWSLTLAGSNGSITLIDDSGKKFGDRLGKAGRVFKVGIGSLNLGTENEANVERTTTTSGKGFGLFYPDKGLIVISPQALEEELGNVTVGGTIKNLGGDVATDIEYKNHERLLQSIQDGGDFQARRTENISTRHFFVRATNREFNFSNNPTYTDDDGKFVESSFETDPRTYITTVGLYNTSNEMVAVAKTSQPIKKSFDREILIKVKLSF